MEADYKVSLGTDGEYMSLKDRAMVEYFQVDWVSVSSGFLTDVTNEMAHKDLLEKIGYLDPLTNLPNRTVMHRSLEMKLS